MPRAARCSSTSPWSSITGQPHLKPVLLELPSQRQVCCVYIELCKRALHLMRWLVLETFTSRWKGSRRIFFFFCAFVFQQFTKLVSFFVDIMLILTSFLARCLAMEIFILHTTLETGSNWYQGRKNQTHANHARWRIGNRTEYDVYRSLVHVCRKEIGRTPWFISFGIPHG